MREYYGYVLESKELMDGAFCQEELINWCYFLLNLEEEVGRGDGVYRI